MKTLVPVLMFLLLLCATACGAHYTIHPGSLNQADSGAYDALLIAEAIIDEARTDHPSSELNALINFYNVTRESWLTYRGALAVNVRADMYFDQLNKNLSDLANAIRTFKEAK